MVRERTLVAGRPVNHFDGEEASISLWDPSGGFSRDQNGAVQVMPVEEEVVDEADEKPTRETREQLQEGEVTREEPHIREVPLPKEPTEIERALHMLTHLPPCSWCATCTKARGRDDAHHCVPVADRITKILTESQCWRWTTRSWHSHSAVGVLQEFARRLQHHRRA